jgi:hypothetical protein
MGTWGTGLLSNDTFADVYRKFFELYNDGQHVKEIAPVIIANHKELLDDKSDSNNFWFAIAKAQWECKSLDKYIFDKVKDIIENKKDLEVWKELGGDEREIEQRDKILLKFLAQISKERTKPKSRRKKKIINPVFEKGSCLTFKLLNGNIGAAIVLEAIYGTPYGYNLVAVTTINRNNKPTIEQIIEADILFLNYGNWDNVQQITWFTPKQFKKDADKFNVIGKIQVTKNYDTKADTFGAAGDWFIWIIETTTNQFEQGKKKLFSKGTPVKKYV